MKQLLVLVFLFAAFILQSHAQESVSTSDKRAVRFFEKARDAFYDRDYDFAKQYVDRALQRDKTFLEAYLLASEIHIEQGQSHQAIDFLEQLYRFDSVKYPKASNLLGSLYMNTRQYNEAIHVLEHYLSLKEDKSTNKKLELARFRQSLIENPLDINPKNLGPGVNTKGCEYVNAITLDGNKLFITRKPEPGSRSRGEKWDEDFYFSEKEDSVWQQTKSLGDQINTPYNEGAMHLSADGTSLFFTSCQGMQGYGSCDLYYTTRINDTMWKQPFNLGPLINTRHWETQPCFSSDGKTLYFVSTRDGGEGGADIWRSRLQDNSEWSEPENLGPEINTKGEEMAPYLHPDGVTLYFSSDGHRGMGGMDIFVSRMNSDSSWSEPKNFGYPLNDGDDQINLIADAEGNTAFFSSADTSGYGCYDIFSFEMPQKHKPEQVAYLKGTVYDKKTREPLQASFELVDLMKDETKVASRSDKQGDFLVALPNGRNYGLHVSKKGYMFYSEHFPFEQETVKPMQKDIYLEPISIEASSRLDNLFFVYDSDSIRQESMAELKQLKAFLETNRFVEIRVEGHTDSRGDEEYNMKLSQKRAEAVKKYLTENGIDEDRLSTKGFGESKPVADNDTEEGRARNRRTEIQITAHLISD